MSDRLDWRRLAALYLGLQAAGGAAWWAVLLAWPASRKPFLVPGAPEATLLGFGVADGLLFVLASAACAWGFRSRAPWAWPLLCVHAGAAAYAALYCGMIPCLTNGGAWAAAVLMMPSLVVPGLLAWRLRPSAAPGSGSSQGADARPGPPRPPGMS